jgi:hypothetical protein
MFWRFSQELRQWTRDLLLAVRTLSEDGVEALAVLEAGSKPLAEAAEVKQGPAVAAPGWRSTLLF